MLDDIYGKYHLWVLPLLGIDSVLFISNSRIGMIMGFFAYIAYHLIGFFIFVLIISIVLSWLIAFNVVNTNNQFVNIIWRTASQVTEPVLRPIRQILPSMGGLDLSPLIVIIVLQAVNGYLLAPLLNKSVY